MISRMVQIYLYYRALGFGGIITPEIVLMHFDARGKCHSQNNLHSAVVTGVTQSNAVGQHYTQLLRQGQQKLWVLMHLFNTTLWVHWVCGVMKHFQAGLRKRETSDLVCTGGRSLTTRLLQEPLWETCPRATLCTQTPSLNSGLKPWECNCMAWPELARNPPQWSNSPHSGHHH